MNNDSFRVPVRLIPGFVFPRYAAWVPFRRLIVYNRKVTPTRRLVAHELVHVVQHERFGVSFYFRYVWGWVLSGFRYWDIPMEVEAREGEKDAFYLSWAEELMRKNGLI